MSSPKANRLKTTLEMPEFCSFCARAGIHEIGYVESSPGTTQLDDEGYACSKSKRKTSFVLITMQYPPA
ncbi:hypothetical protein CEP52_007911, partial [Fusarium oligoseptatum]